MPCLGSSFIVLRELRFTCVLTCFSPPSFILFARLSFVEAWRTFPGTLLSAPHTRAAALPRFRSTSKMPGPGIQGTHPHTYGPGSRTWCVRRRAAASAPRAALLRGRQAATASPAPLPPRSRRCGNGHGLIRKYKMMLCRR